MGRVYKAHDSRLGPDVALKVLREDVVEHPRRQSRFEIEARAVALSTIRISFPFLILVKSTAVRTP
jgi:serine/threonine protein kinase